MNSGKRSGAGGVVEFSIHLNHATSQQKAGNLELELTLAHRHVENKRSAAGE